MEKTSIWESFRMWNCQYCSCFIVVLFSTKYLNTRDEAKDLSPWSLGAFCLSPTQYLQVGRWVERSEGIWGWGKFWDLSYGVLSCPLKYLQQRSHRIFMLVFPLVFFFFLILLSCYFLFDFWSTLIKKKELQILYEFQFTIKILDENLGVCITHGTATWRVSLRMTLGNGSSSLQIL